MKKLRLFCAIGALLMASTMNAKVGDTFTEGQFKYKVLSEEGITESGVTTVTGGTVSATNRVSGYDYSSVYNNPQSHDNMKSVTIPSTVKRIEGNAFSGNQTSKNSLRNVYLSEGLIHRRGRICKLPDRGNRHSELRYGNRWGYRL